MVTPCKPLNASSKSSRSLILPKVNIECQSTTLKSFELSCESGDMQNPQCFQPFEVDSNLYII